MKKIQIFEDDTLICNVPFSVNTTIFKGRLCDDVKKMQNGVISFSIRLSNGKNEKTGEWNKGTFAHCTAFKEHAEKILENYKPKDEIFILCKFYNKQHQGKYYKGFYVKDILDLKLTENKVVDLDDDFLPF